MGRCLSIVLCFILFGCAIKPLVPHPKISFRWPVENGRISNPFTGSHEGLDIAAPKSTPIYSAHQGQVLYAGNEFSGYGNVVFVQFGQWTTVYAHCEKLLVQTGDFVGANTVVCTMGDTGNARGVHLHFEIRRGSTPLNPIEYLPKT